MKQILKLCYAFAMSGIVAWVASIFLGLVNEQWTNSTMELARNNIGNLEQMRTDVRFWELVGTGTWIIAALIIGIVWYLLYKNQLRKFFMATSAILMIALVGCIPNQRVVLITPPNYGIVVSLSNTGNQVTGNNFDNGELLNVTQQQVNVVRCAANSSDDCPDKIVVEVQGSPESRIYTASTNSGTAEENQSLCFEASGANGCVDFSVTAIINKSDAKCYANKMGVLPVKESNGSDSIFHFKAIPLASALDTRVIQVASSVFAQQVAATSPLELALKKFDLFNDSREQIQSEVHDQTCITITNMGINNGIAWTDQSIQDQINEATILANQMDLVERQNNLAQKQMEGFVQRALMLEQQFGLPAAIEFMRIQKWDGSYLPALIP